MGPKSNKLFTQLYTIIDEFLKIDFKIYKNKRITPVFRNKYINCYLDMRKLNMKYVITHEISANEHDLIQITKYILGMRQQNIEKTCKKRFKVTAPKSINKVIAVANKYNNDDDDVQEIDYYAKPTSKAIEDDEDEAIEAIEDNDDDEAIEDDVWTEDEKEIYNIVKKNSKNYDEEVVKNRIFEQILTKEAEIVSLFSKTHTSIEHFMSILAQISLTRRVLIFFKNWNDLILNKIRIVVIASIHNSPEEIEGAKTDLKQLINLSINAEHAATEEEDDDCVLNEYDTDNDDSICEKASEIVEENIKANVLFEMQKNGKKDFHDIDRNNYTNYKTEILDEMMKRGLSFVETRTKVVLKISDETIVKISGKDVQLNRISKGHPHFSGGDVVSVSFNMTSKCEIPVYSKVCDLMTDINFYKTMSFMLGLAGRPSVKSYKSIDDDIKTKFESVDKNSKLTILKIILDLQITCFPIFVMNMLTEFASQKIGVMCGSMIPVKIIGHLDLRYATTQYATTQYDSFEKFMESVILLDGKTTFNIHAKITNDSNLIISKGGGIIKKMKGGAILYNIEYLFSIYLNGIVSLFTTFNQNFVPINDLLSQFIVDLNIYGRDTAAPERLWIAAQVGGGGQSCYGIGKKADFDARVYLTNAEYMDLIAYILGRPDEHPVGVFVGGHLSKLSNYINFNKESYFNPAGYSFVLDEYTFKAVFEKTQIRQHKPEGGKFPVQLISIDIVWRVSVLSAGVEIGYFFHYSGIFDLVVKYDHTYDEVLECVINPYGENNCCPIYTMSCLTSTILETFSDALNVFNRVGTFKLIKDFLRLEDICDKSLKYYPNNMNADVSRLKTDFSEKRSQIIDSVIPAGKTITQHHFDEFAKHSKEISTLVTNLVTQIKEVDIAWHLDFASNMIFDPRAAVFHELVYRDNSESAIIIMKQDAAINIYMSYLYFNENPKRESYFDIVGELKKILQTAHETSFVSSFASSFASSAASSQNYDDSVMPFVPFDKNFGGKKTRKYLKKTNLKKSRKQRKSKKHVSKSNRKTKRK